MLDESARGRPLPPPGVAPAGPAPGGMPGWVAEFRREQARFVRTALHRDPGGRLPYGIAAVLAVAAALVLLLPGWPAGPGTATAPVPSAAGEELAEAREEALAFDLAQARQEAEGLRAAAARSEARRERAEAARAEAEARSTALAQDLDGARSDLAAVRAGFERLVRQSGAPTAPAPGIRRNPAD